MKKGGKTRLITTKIQIPNAYDKIQIPNNIYEARSIEEKRINYI